MAICEEWQKLTKLQLEYAYYETMVIRDVNNYISKTISGKIKYKGLFDYKDMPLNKNHSNKIIPIALEAHFINSIPIEQTIRNHTNIFDFCRGIKAKSNSKYLFFDSKGQSRVLQKVNRYFVCTPQAQEKGRIVKVYDDNRKALVEATKSYQKVVNKIDKDKMNLYLKEINYAFYEKETRK